MQLIHSFFVASLFASVATAFAPTLSSKRPFFVHKMNDEWSSSEASGGGSGGIERLEFTIFPDGRVEEVVRGIKGPRCQEVTEKLNSMLGEVISSKPTEEMFEEELTVDQTLYDNDSTSTTW